MTQTGGASSYYTKQGEENMTICTCLVCESKWSYPDSIDVGLIRASCAPCGHQGMFKVMEKVEDKKKGNK